MRPEKNRRICARRTTVAGTIRAVGQIGLDLLFPPKCTYCDATILHPQDDVWLCQSCRAALTSNTPDFCDRCGLPVSNATSCNEDMGCARCRGRRLSFHRTVVLNVYRGELQRAIIRMKRFSEIPLTSSVGRLLGDKISEQMQDNSPDIVLSVPKFWTRRVVRGTNSAEILMEAIAHRLDLEGDDQILRCRRNTKKQSTLSLSERPRNIRGAFSVCAGYDLSSAHAMIVDDIMTTGATAQEASRALKAAGAKRISVAVAGRTIVG